MDTYQLSCRLTGVYVTQDEKSYERRPQKSLWEERVKKIERVIKKEQRKRPKRIEYLQDKRVSKRRGEGTRGVSETKKKRRRYRSRGRD